MGEPLRTLIVEDSESDAQLLLRELDKAGFEPWHVVVETKDQFLAALGAETWDVILSDYCLPTFDAPRALAALQSTGLDLPFIVISGTVGEDIAVQTMRAGAHDYLLKGSLTRLGEAIRRERRDAAVRREHRAGLKKIEHLSRVLRGIRNVNQLIVREKDPEILLRQSCHELVNSRGYQAAWAFLTEPAVSSGRVVAEQGFGGAFDAMHRRLVGGFVPACCDKADAAHGPVTIVDPRSECPADCPMLAATGAGCLRGATLMVSPLESHEQRYGFVLVEAPAELDTDDEETGLLAEVSGDIAFALHGNEVERQRREAEELFQLSFENATIGKSLTSPAGEMFKVNAALCSLLGYSREELETKHLIDVTHREDRAASRESVRCLLAGDKASDRLEKRYLHKDGRTVWGDVSTILLRNRDGSPRCFITHVLDISDHKRFEAALRKSEAQLSSALQMARAGHWEYDVAGDMFTFNDNFYRIFRTTAAEVGGYEMSSAEYAGRFCHPDDAGLVAQEVRAAIETTDPSHRRQLEHRVLFADGEIGHIAVRFSVIKDAQGRTVSTFGVNQDITERMRFQAQIAQSDRLASMGMLAAGVAHEINNPLSYVLYNLASLDDDLPRIAAAWKRCVSEATDRLGRGAWVALLGSDRDLLAPAMLDDVLERFNDALHGTRRIKDIARGLATFSRVEQDRLVQVDLSEVIEAAIDMVFNEIKYRARLVKEYGKVATIAANDGRLSQVFLNLLINATHAIEEGDQEGNEIRVRTWQQGDEVFAEVRDTGSGIAPKDLPHLFEPFFTTKAIGVGTGLGLSISKNIVESYRGRIEVTSTLGKGTSFVVRLPVSSSTASTGPRAAASPRMASPAHPGAGGRILIVDDEPGIRAAMVRMLLGNQVVEACSGEEARKILEGDQAFDVILCDMMMPTMSGVDLHEWILQEHPALADQLVFITGGAFTPKARDHLAAVSNVRLEKPFDVDTLRQVVAKMILAARPPG